MAPVLRLGPFTLPTAPFVLLAIFFILQEVGDRAAKRLKLPEGIVSITLYWIFGVGLVAARLGYVIRNLDAYLADPLQLFALNFGTLDVLTGALFGFVAGLAYLQRQRLTPLTGSGQVLRLFGDAIAPALALAFAVYSLGNLLTGDAYGVPAPGLPWGIFLWGEWRQPTQLYELAAYLAIFWFLWFRAPRPFDGARFLMAAALLAGVRVLLEPLRGDSVAWVAGLRSAQVIAFVVMTLALILLAYGLRPPGIIAPRLSIARKAFRKKSV